MTAPGEPSTTARLGTAGVVHRAVSSAASARANRLWWDADARSYQDEHGAFLGDVALRWCPEGATEDDLRLLGEVAGKRVLEVGCGAAAVSRWLATRGAVPTGIDLSAGMLAEAVAGARRSGVVVPLVQAEAERLPFADGVFDLACSAFGAVPFCADSALVMREVARVLAPGGRWVFATTHPVRWIFPDDPGPAGLVAQTAYFDRTPYAEVDDSGRETYVEHHRTIGDRVREIVGAGFRLVDIVEPEWTPGNEQVWGQWSPERGAILPGTAIYVCDKPS